MIHAEQSWLNLCCAKQYMQVSQAKGATQAAEQSSNLSNPYLRKQSSAE